MIEMMKSSFKFILIGLITAALSFMALTESPADAFATDENAGGGYLSCPNWMDPANGLDYFTVWVEVDEADDYVDPYGYIDAGQTVVFQVAPVEGSSLRGVSVQAGNGELVEVTERSSGALSTYSFVMPSSDAAISAEVGGALHSIGGEYDPHGTINITDAYGNRVSEIESGEEVVATFKPDSGYVLESAYLLYSVFNGEHIEVREPLNVVDDKAVFTMPFADVNIETTFVRTDGKRELFVYAYARGGSIETQDKLGNETYFFKPGDKVYIDISVNDGYELARIYVIKNNDDRIEATLESDGRYSFVMPDEDLNINAGFDLVGGGIPFWAYEEVVNSDGSGAGTGDAFGTYTFFNEAGATIYGQHPGEKVNIRVIPDEDHRVHSVVYSYADENYTSHKVEATVDEAGVYSFEMPRCEDIQIYINYQRTDDQYDLTVYCQELAQDGLTARFTDENGREIVAAKPGDVVYFEYLPGSGFILDYVLNYEAGIGSCEKINAAKYKFVMPDGPLLVDIGLSRVDVNVETDEHALIPDSGKQAVESVALRAFWLLMTGDTPDGMTRADANALRDLLNDPDSLNVYLDVLVKANETNMTTSEEGLVLDIIQNGEYVVFSFDLSVMMTASNGEEEKTANLAELDEGVHFQLMPGNTEGKFVRVVRIHNGEAQLVPIVGVSSEGIMIEADRFSTYSVVASDATVVAFDSRGGSTVASQEVGYGDKLAKPADPTWEGHEFLGWYKDAALSDPYNFSEPVIEHIGTLYAKWSEEAVAGGSSEISGVGTTSGSASNSSSSSMASTGDAMSSLVALAGILAAVSLLAIILNRKKIA